MVFFKLKNSAFLRSQSLTPTMQHNPAIQLFQPQLTHGSAIQSSSTIAHIFLPQLFLRLNTIQCSAPSPRDPASPACALFLPPLRHPGVLPLPPLRHQPGVPHLPPPLHQGLLHPMPPQLLVLMAGARMYQAVVSHLGEGRSLWQWGWGQVTFYIVSSQTRVSESLFSFRALPRGIAWF